jgi:DNA-3-methyladenine glycosylase II
LSLNPRPLTLTRARLALAVHELARRDADLAGVVRRHGVPPLWARRPGFGTLLHIILEQQVSLASARAAYRKLETLIGPPAPAPFLALDDETLKRVGFSRQKAAYGRELARAVIAGELDLRGLRRLPDDAVRAALTRLKGIGPWTAEIYLLMVLRRPDAWPAGDLALAVAAQRLKHRPALPGRAELESLAAAWRPWRAVAARLLWHDYLSDPPRRTTPAQ